MSATEGDLNNLKKILPQRNQRSIPEYMMQVRVTKLFWKMIRLFLKRRMMRLKFYHNQVVARMMERPAVMMMKMQASMVPGYVLLLMRFCQFLNKIDRKLS